MIHPMTRARKGTLPAEETQRADGKRPPVSVREAGELLGVSRWTVYDMIRRGEIRSIPVGRFQKIRRAEIDRYLDQQERLAKKYAS
jgi:excisionase family DNA binding protein